MFHIMINKNSKDEQRGKASNRDELFKLLKKDEIKKVFDHEAYNALDDLFKEALKKENPDSYITEVSGIQVNVVSDGYKITTLVFYF